MSNYIFLFKYKNVFKTAKTVVMKQVVNKDIQKLCEDKEIEIDVSISHIKENATSTVVVKVNKE